MRTPDFLIVGAAKSGTTSLSNYLNQHPQIEIVSNRLEYFGEYSNAMMPDLSQEDYLDLFSDIPSEKAAGEKSVSYLYSDLAPEQIKMINPEIKILIILRNPIDRAYSDYWHRKRNGMEELRFEKALKIEDQRIKNNAPFEQHYANYGLYTSKVENYFSTFGKEQCKVLLFDNFIQKPLLSCNECFTFLNVGSTNTQINVAIHNKGGTPKQNILAKILFKLSRKRSLVKLVRSLIPESIKKIVTNWMNKYTTDNGYPAMDSQTRNKLINFYKSDIKKLKKLLNKDLSTWLEAK